MDVANRPILALIGPRKILDPDALRAAALPHLTNYLQHQPDALAISELASGADTILLAAAADCGYSIGITVPYPGYRDVSSPSEETLQAELRSRAALIHHMADPGEPDAAIAAAGYWLVDHANTVLVASDGTDSAVAGGTADLMRRAASRGIPVIVITIAHA